MSGIQKFLRPSSIDMPNMALKHYVKECLPEHKGMTKEEIRKETNKKRYARKKAGLDIFTEYKE